MQIDFHRKYCQNNFFFFPKMEASKDLFSLKEKQRRKRKVTNTSLIFLKIHSICNFADKQKGEATGIHFQWNKKPHFFIVKVSEHWHRFLRDAVGSPFLEIFRTPTEHSPVPLALSHHA